MDEVIRLVEQAQADGLPVTADMYNYEFSGTGLSSCIPPWAHDGGHKELIVRLKDPATRERIKQDMNTPSREWENMYNEYGPTRILLSGFQTDALKDYTGKTLAGSLNRTRHSPR